VRYGNKAVVVLLTQPGAVVDAKNEQDMNAIEYAIHKGEDELARYLVQEGKYRKGGNRMAMAVLEKLITERKVEDKWRWMDGRFEAGSCPKALPSSGPEQNLTSSPVLS
jgi:hypothetical protein